MYKTTIAAISTPLGAGGIGIVRISGPQALKVAEGVFRPLNGMPLSRAKGYTASLGRVFDKGGDLDDCVAIFYRAPKSYTGEDVVELCCHGGVWIVRTLLRLCLENGAAAAAPGEFTKRAYLNGKLSLSQAEAVMELVGAQGESAMRAALAARDGRLSTETDEIVENLLGCSAHFAAWADYPEEELEAVDSGRLSASVREAASKTARLLDSWDRGRILREGVLTAIVGKPNAGKSTLMNLLSGYDRSIVSELPGTTRDVVEDMVRWGDIVLRLADTAGLRDSCDPIENIGVEKAKGMIETAELVLAVFDSSVPLDERDKTLLELIRGKRCIAVINKSDLPCRLDVKAIAAAIPCLVETSAVSGKGRQELEAAVRKLLGMGDFDPSAAIVFGERQRQCLTRALKALNEAESALECGVTLDAVNILIDGALDALLSLTGKKVTDIVVDEVFARFCVGK